eukprot:CAMPEP_0201664696 /NCGR_PEP_ID=MMETSP0494-20130426/6080_1 /ASSEMBLY_ACC=CAM_ASM_000839 /TAXON_ID=420259 /ORGANISM="Thalassiosira gravida, Strain GMp14c1" /LENGTH=116 /DNA_ID=CAMNT_0048143515 /DNA_START=717 /DNA_END=1067 /DNA_ORIENTATION=+
MSSSIDSLSFGVVLLEHECGFGLDMPVDFIVGTGDCDDAIEVSPRENLTDENGVDSLDPLFACAYRDGDASAAAGDCFPTVFFEDAFLHASRIGLFGSIFPLFFLSHSACSLIANS